MIKNNAEQRKQEIEQRKIKNEIISNFEAAGKYIGEQLQSAAKNFLDENINPLVDYCATEINAIESKVAESKIAAEKISDLLKRTENLIGAIQENFFVLFDDNCYNLRGITKSRRRQIL